MPSPYLPNIGRATNRGLSQQAQSRGFPEIGRGLGGFPLTSDEFIVRDDFDFLLVGGGGGGGLSTGGGGGAGEVIMGKLLYLPLKSKIIIGAGGPPGTASATNNGFTYNGYNGEPSFFNNIKACGGGGGYGGDIAAPTGRYNNARLTGSTGGTGLHYVTSLSNATSARLGAGFPGGTNDANSGTAASGGGGAGGPGKRAGDINASWGGDGGKGVQWLDGGWYGYGGGGAGASVGGAAHPNGHGRGDQSTANNGMDGEAYTGGGGGGGSLYPKFGAAGTFKIRYRGRARFTGGTITFVKGFTYHHFTTPTTPQYLIYKG